LALITQVHGHALDDGPLGLGSPANDAGAAGFVTHAALRFAVLAMLTNKSRNGTGVAASSK
jgi:hypothetical protein